LLPPASYLAGAKGERPAEPQHQEIDGWIVAAERGTAGAPAQLWVGDRLARPRPAQLSFGSWEA